MSASQSASISASKSASTSASLSASTSLSLSASRSVSTSVSTSASLSASRSVSTSISISNSIKNSDVAKLNAMKADVYALTIGYFGPQGIFPPGTGPGTIPIIQYYVNGYVVQCNATNGIVAGRQPCSTLRNAIFGSGATYTNLIATLKSMSGGQLVTGSKPKGSTKITS